jgi:hypothetical protein
VKYPESGIKKQPVRGFPLLQQMLEALSLPERKSLQRWVASPAFNRRPEVERLFTLLIDAIHPEKPMPLPERPELYRHVLQQPPAGATLSAREENALRHTASYLYEVLREWLAWRDWSDDDSARRLHLCRALRKKRLNSVFEREFAQLAPPKGQRSTRFYLSQYLIGLETWEFAHANGSNDPAALYGMGQSFGAFVTLSALRHGCAALDQSASAFSENDIEYLPESLLKVRDGKFDAVPAIQVYFYCFLLMRDHEQADFYTLKQLLNHFGPLFPPEEIRDVWLVAINFAIRKLNTGAREWVREAFELYRSGLERDILLDNGKMPKATYQNVLLLAIASGEASWARQFLENYRSALAPGERYNAYLFNLALWHFRAGEYPEAQEILRRVEFRDVYYNIDARRMLVRMYYDQGELNALDALLHSFSNYLQRHRNIGYHRDLNLNFIRIVQKLIQTPSGDTPTREKIRQKILKESYLAERDWLLGHC